MEIMFYVMIFVLGLCFGSFVNMLVYRTAVRYKLKRLPRFARNDVGGRSFCDYCGKQLSWYENIPVISWLILKGKTKCCHKKLPISYPITELITGLLLILNFQFLISNDQLNWLTVLLSLIIIVFLVFSAVFDLKYMILPDFSTIVLIVMAFVLLFVETPRGASLQSGVLSALVAAGFLLILNLITKGKGMGMGDVKLAIFMGLFLGPQKTIVAFYVAFIVGAIYGLILMALKKAKKKSQIPFGPFLILGIFVAWWFGQKIVELIGL